MNRMEKLFEPGRIGKLSIRNRIVMAPMGIIGLTEPDGRILQRAIDLLLGRKKAGERVIVAGGGLIGCETAIYLAQKGKTVTIVEMLEEIIPDVFEANRQYLFKMLAENGVNVLTNTNMVRVTDDGAVVINQYRRYEAKLPADTIVIATGLKPERSLVKALEGKVRELHAIGDCEEPGKIMDAVWGAFNTARTL